MSNIFTDAYRTVAICPEDDCRTISYLSQVNEGRQAVYYLPWNAAVIWNKKLEYRREPRTSGLIGLQGRQNKISEHQTKAGNQEHFLTLTCSQSFTLSFNHSRQCWTTFVLMSMLKVTLSFNHSWHAEQLLFSCLCSKFAVFGKNCNGYFLTSSSSPPSPVSLDVIELVPS